MSTLINLLHFNRDIILNIFNKIYEYRKEICWLNCSCILLGIAFILYLRYVLYKRQVMSQNKKNLKIAFFHPHCNAAGGGEKVLWKMITSISALKNIPKEIVIFSAEECSDNEIYEKAYNRFGFQRTSDIQIQFVHEKSILLPKTYFTIIFQIVGTIYFALKAVFLYQPHIFIDTQGYAFSYFIVKLFIPNVQIISYVHYPFVSTDMLQSVLSKRQKFNNSGRIANSIFLSLFKYVYYLILIALYKCMGLFANIIFTNSTWTNNHIKKLWGSKSQIIYPPCSIKDFMLFDVLTKQNLIVSFAQFRPEKRQLFQIELFYQLKLKYPSMNYKFCLMGACRGPEDELLLHSLQQKVAYLGLQNDVYFEVNKPFNIITSILKQAKIGLHTMEDEHFGITIVEMMAAGLITITHNSAGAKFDIIKEQEKTSGILCDSNEQFLNSLQAAINMEEEPRVKITCNARRQINQFSDENFVQTMTEQFYKILNLKALQVFKMKLQ